VFGCDKVEHSRHFRRQESEHSRHFRQQKSEHSDGNGHYEGRGMHVAASTPSLALEKVRFALRQMGFRDAQARRAIAEVAKMHGETPTLEQALREALLVATATCG
jgi:Holliday junction resolvasome RuvABC DNA-binding subunit